MVKPVKQRKLEFYYLLNNGPWTLIDKSFGTRRFVVFNFIMFQVREHAAAVLAGLTKGGDEDLAKDFREKAYKEATDLQRKRKRRYFPCFCNNLVLVLVDVTYFSIATYFSFDI